jgi:hypothetical protein
MRVMVVIEFRSGTYFQSLAADHGGPITTAQAFESEDVAEEFMREHDWILFNGGMVVPANKATYSAR